MMEFKAMLANIIQLATHFYWQFLWGPLWDIVAEQQRNKLRSEKETT